MSRESEERIIEWAYWFHEHKDDGGGPDMKIKFLLKAVDGCFELLVRCLQDIQELEGRSKRETNNLLLTPKYKKHRIL